MFYCTSGHVAPRVVCPPLTGDRVRSTSGCHRPQAERGRHWPRGCRSGVHGKKRCPGQQSAADNQQGDAETCSTLWSQETSFVSFSLVNLPQRKREVRQGNVSPDSRVLCNFSSGVPRPVLLSISGRDDSENKVFRDPLAIAKDLIRYVCICVYIVCFFNLFAPHRSPSPLSAQNRGCLQQPCRRLCDSTFLPSDVAFVHLQSIYAVGDCCTKYQFTHAADFMARIVIRNALFFGEIDVSTCVTVCGVLVMFSVEWSWLW